VIQYKDDEGDLINIQDNDDLILAYECAHDNFKSVLKLFIIKSD